MSIKETPRSSAKQIPVQHSANGAQPRISTMSTTAGRLIATVRNALRIGPNVVPSGGAISNSMAG